MKTRHIVIVMVAVTTAAGSARADFDLYDNQYSAVSSTHTTVNLYDTSTVQMEYGGYIQNVYVNNGALLRASDFRYGTRGRNVGSLHAYDTGRVDVSGGSITMLYAHDAASIDISGGMGFYIYAYATSRLNISGGSVAQLRTFSTSIANISGSTGTIGDLLTYDESNVDISAGTFFHLDTYNTSTVDIGGGNTTNMKTHDTSRVDIDAGYVHWVSTYDTSNVQITGGTVGHFLRTYDTTAAQISGGWIKNLDTYHTSSVDISGGTIGNDLGVHGTSTVTFYGYDFQATGNLTLVGTEVLGTGRLTGKWRDGTPWGVDITTNDSGATIQAVPAPLSGVGATVFLSPATAVGEGATIANPNMTVQVGKTITLGVWISAPEGMGVDRIALDLMETAGILDANSMTILETGGFPRWYSVVDPNLNTSAQELYSGSSVAGQEWNDAYGLSGNAIVRGMDGNFDPAAADGNGAFLYAIIEFTPTTVGDTDLYLKVGGDTITYAPNTDTAIHFGVGDDPTWRGAAGAVSSLPDATIHVVLGPFTTGDVDGDGNVDNLDVTAFAAAVIADDEAAFLLLYPEGEYWAGDINFDGTVDNLDITPFVDLVLAGGQTIPEPATLLIMAAAGLPVLLRRRRRR